MPAAGACRAEVDLTQSLEHTSLHLLLPFFSPLFLSKSDLILSPGLLFVLLFLVILCIFQRS